jgi:hypothetical protein
MIPIIYLGILLTLILGLPLFGLLLARYSIPTHLTIFPIPTEPGESSISCLAWGISRHINYLHPYSYHLAIFLYPSDNQEEILSCC